MITTNELSNMVSNKGYTITIDHESPYMVIARIQKNGLEFLLRVSAQRVAVWFGSDRINHNGGKTWQQALATTLDEIERMKFVTITKVEELAPVD